MGLSDYEEMLTNVITQEDIVSGSGIWFAPYAYDSNEKYVGPYVYKDGSSTVVTYDYSNAEYDYVSQEYYTIAESSTEPVITDPYYVNEVSEMSENQQNIADTLDSVVKKFQL